MDSKQEKISLRKQIRKQKVAFKRDGIISSDKQILDRVLALLEYAAAGMIFCFVSTPTEINTIPLLEHAFAQDKGVAVPRCAVPGIMEVCQIHSFQELTPGAYGILEPKDTCRIISKQEIDFAIVPCMSCDRECNRLGQGGGYYDRFMTERTYLAAALCREALLLDHVPLEPWDQPVDMVVTEEGIYRKKSGK